MFPLPLSVSSLRAAEAAVVAAKQAEMKAKVRAARKAREKLVAAVEIEQKRLERQRREELRAECGADVLSLRGLGMHKVSVEHVFSFVYVFVVLVDICYSCE